MNLGSGSRPKVLAETSGCEVAAVVRNESSGRCLSYGWQR